MSAKFRFDHPDDAIAALGERLKLVGIDKGIADPVGRILATAVTADRDSPAADVSAMDGYAVRLSDLQHSGELPVVGEVAAGAEPPVMPTTGVLRIFTGAVVPAGADAVIKREDTIEREDSIEIPQAEPKIGLGDHIRRAGENAKAGSEVLASGTELTAAQIATMINFGCFAADVFRRVRVAIVTTGDEVDLFKDRNPQPWQLRNSNQATLQAMLTPANWLTVSAVTHCKDDPAALKQVMTDHLTQHDAVLLTGGVSMGNYDFVPDVVREVGGEVVFHGLPIRPGKPVLGAVTSEGKLILGLPGNPVSAAVGCRRLAFPLLAKLAGNRTSALPDALSCPTVELSNAGDKTLPLHWMRLVRVISHGQAELITSQGSGDLVALGKSTGFVEVPPGESGVGPWPYYAW